jgi:threonine dehydrogenase-like Zn-dependent dehydrogenase
MKALVWRGKHDIRCEEVSDPKIEHPRDAIVKVTSCALCGTDLHMYNGFVPSKKSGHVIGHEFMGEVVEVGPEIKNLRVGERVVVSCYINCGTCEQCQRGYFAFCETSNRYKELAEKAFGHTVAGLFGFTELTGGYQGAQAEYVRVPLADTTHIKIPDGVPDEQVLFVSDSLATGWQAALQCDIEPTDTVAIWGLGAIGQFALRSAILLGAKQVIAIDRVPERLEMARAGGATVINFEEESAIERLNELTQGKGPQKCVDAVGMEAHVSLRSPDTIVDRAKQTVMLESDRPHVLREMMYVCRPGGTLSVPGLYAGLVDKIPFGAAMNKGLTIRPSLAHVPRWSEDLLRLIQEGLLDPSFVITHNVPLDRGPEMYTIFNDKLDGCVKVVLKP